MKTWKLLDRRRVAWLGCLVTAAGFAAEEKPLPPLPPFPPSPPVRVPRKAPVTTAFPTATSTPVAVPSVISNAVRQGPGFGPARPFMVTTGAPLLRFPTAGTNRAFPGAGAMPLGARTNRAGFGYAQPLPPPQQEKAFAWDALVKEYNAKPGELTASFSFCLTNVSGADVTINSVRTSCGCTVAKLPSVPWHLAAGTNGTFEVTADLRGKSGVLAKTVTIDSTAGFRFLTVRVSIPGGPAMAGTSMGDRSRNMQVAMADRQAVFKNDCGTCHLQPAIGKKGEQLYKAACGVCHEAEHRASMVPNLHALNKPTDREYWKTWATKGKTNTLMPAFSIAEGGPLSEEQITSLVDYLVGGFQSRPTVTHTLPQPAPSPGIVVSGAGSAPGNPKPAGPAVQ